MKVWRRTYSGFKSSISGLTFDQVTDVSEDGNYYTRFVWSDGEVTGEYRSNVLEMGWPSVKEFLAGKSGFKLVEETEGEQNEP